jgi:uncharacterized membrane protein YphA (DoxX/SURF4 family)
MQIKAGTIAPLFLRLALAVSFLSAVADRFGWWGTPGTAYVSWGNWENFVAYSNSVNSFISPRWGNALAGFATFMEVALALLLLIGYRLKITAMTSGVLMLLFALAMTFSFGPKPAMDYSVWTAAAACFVLAGIQHQPYSIDYIITKNKS